MGVAGVKAAVNMVFGLYNTEIIPQVRNSLYNKPVTLKINLASHLLYKSIDATYRH